MGKLGGGTRKLLLGLVWLISLCQGAWAADSCPVVFSGGLQTHGASGGVLFQWSGQLLGNPTPAIDTLRVQGNPWGLRSCGSLNCQASGRPAADLGPLMLPAIVASHDLRLTAMLNGEAGGDELNRYRQIEVGAGADLH